MDNEMIERCAKAVCLEHWTDDSRYKNYIPAVKATIKAMREPTEKMIEAATWNTTNGEIVGDDLAKVVWQDMIDCIINDD